MIFKNIFDSFNKKKQSVNIPLQVIPWSEIVDECYDRQLNFMYDISKVIYTDDRTERAVILRKPNGLYTVIREKLYQFDDDELKYGISDLHGYWHTENDIGSTFDTEERAENEIMTSPPFKYNRRT